MICRKLLIYPAAEVFFVLDQISGLLSCWEEWNKQCSNSIFKKWAMVIKKKNKQQQTTTEKDFQK